MKMTRTQLASLVKSTKTGYRDTGDYIVLGSEKVSKIIHQTIPECTGNRLSGFPNYLKGFEDYYEKRTYFGFTYYNIKKEYEDKSKRPMYELEITYNLLDIELTERGKKECERRFNIHKRNMEKYAYLLG